MMLVLAKQIKCAFCKGKGKDPFELLSPLSECQVCNGSGKVIVETPNEVCPFCHGTGIHRGQRLTCIVCGGKGVVCTKGLSKTCPDCNGTGVPPGDYLPCTTCKGIGQV